MLASAPAMPIIERDPWRDQYFEGVACPDDVVIPTDDEHAWTLYPAERWIYNKLAICETQGLAGAPHGVPPESYPVFSKPMCNLHGMGAGGRPVETPEELEVGFEPGHMWMEMLSGEHLSTDVAVIRGEPVWWRHTEGKALDGGMFDYWTVLAEARPQIESYGGDWLRRHLPAYTGFVNLETLGGRIAEAHLRFADQWPDLYGGRRWVEAVVELYSRGTWSYPDDDRRAGYSVVLFGVHGPQYVKPDPALVEEICSHPEISSVQLTFHEDRPPEAHSMPPGGFRLAVINAWDLDVAIEARARLALRFWSVQKIRRKRDQP